MRRGYLKGQTHHGSAISEGMRKAIANGKQMGRKRVHNHEEIIKHFKSGIPQYRIAIDMKCSQSVVHQVLKKAGLI